MFGFWLVILTAALTMVLVAKYVKSKFFATVVVGVLLTGGAWIAASNSGDVLLHIEVTRKTASELLSKLSETVSTVFNHQHNK